MNVSQSSTCIYKELWDNITIRGPRTPSRQNYKPILQVTKTDDDQITSQALQCFYDAYATYDSILHVEHHFLHHSFHPHPQLHLAKCLQIIKHIKSSATHWRKIHMMSGVTYFSYFFLPKIVLYIMYMFSLKMYHFWPWVHGPKHFSWIIAVYLIKHVSVFQISSNLSQNLQFTNLLLIDLYHQLKYLQQQLHYCCVHIFT